MAFNSKRDLTPEVYNIFLKNMDVAGTWRALIQKAVEQPEAKYRDLDWLTSVLFYARHKEREWPLGSGDYLPIDKDNQPASVAEWWDLRKLIAPLLPAAAKEAELNPVRGFILDKRPLVLLDDPKAPGDHMLQGGFTLWLTLDPRLPDPGVYEYRQLIKGGAFSQRGMFASGSWAAMGPIVQAPAKLWLIPSSSLGDLHGTPGLSTTDWKEDGVIDTIDGNRFYGHRDRPAFPLKNGERDEYKPRQSDGTEYFLGDVVGLRGQPPGSPFRVAIDERVRVDIWFQGQVVRFDKPSTDKSRRILKTVWTLFWSLNFDFIVTSHTPLMLVPTP